MRSLSHHLAFAALLLVLPVVIWSIPAAGQANDLSAVLSRASQYVALYEDSQLGNVLAAENYTQKAVFYSGIGIIRARQERQTQADFLIVKIGSERIAVRQVNRVDRAVVKKNTPDLETIMNDTPEGIRRQIAAFREESAQYNIGGVLRHINLPTFALQVIREDQVPRFEFVKHGTGKIRGIEVWEIRFQELRSPTLVHGTGGESLISNGTLWIEPGTGRVLKTEFSVANPFSNPAAKGKTTVTYTPNAVLGMLVPSEMTEHYETDLSAVDCIATYSNFRSFKVDISTGADRVLPKP